MPDDLAVLFPDQEVTVGGEVVKISPLKFGQLPRAIELMAPVVRALNDSKLISFEKTGDQVTYRIADNWLDGVEKLLLDGGEPLMLFLAFALRKKREWLDTIDADDGVMLCKAVFGINASFFNQRIRPMLPVLATPPAGEPSLPDSSSPATTSAASATIQ